MIKKLIGLVVVFAFTFNAFSFEGVITQEAFSKTSGHTTLTWSIKGHQVALKMEMADLTLHMIPDNGSVLIYSDRKMEDGNYYYSKINMAEVVSNINFEGSVKQTNATLKINDQACNQLLVSGNHNGKVWFDTSVDVEMAKLAGYFKAMYEFKFMVEAGVNGFPLKSSIEENGTLVSSLTTLSIEKTSVSTAVFSPPAQYKQQDISVEVNK